MKGKIPLKQGEGNGQCTFCLTGLLLDETNACKAILQLLYFRGMNINDKIHIIHLTGKLVSKFTLLYKILL